MGCFAAWIYLDLSGGRGDAGVETSLCCGCRTIVSGGFEGFWKPSTYGEMVINGVCGIVICERVFIT